jgi:hypothetical protein
VKAEAKPEARTEKAEKGALPSNKVSALPPTSTAAADPMAGIGKPSVAPPTAGAAAEPAGATGKHAGAGADKH